MKDKTMKLDLQMFATASTQNQNTTGASGMSAEMKTFYEKRLIDQAEPALVHDQFGDPYPIPANGGKNIEGSPPHRRGKGAGQSGNTAKSRITPALAGKSPASQPWSPPLWIMVIRPRP